jgi:putative membrane protein
MSTSIFPKPLIALLLIVLPVLAWSWHEPPADRLTWWLEALPVVLALPLLLTTGRRFPLTPLLYGVITIHMVFLLVGAHYTYSQTPFGFWLKDLLALERNPYDRLGHFLQGGTPALLAREIFVRLAIVRGKGWQQFLAVAVALAFSAFYELLEWGAAMAYGAEAEHFLAMQGDIWDTQWDMATALLAAVSILPLSDSLHRRQISALTDRLDPAAQPSR